MCLFKITFYILNKTKKKIENHKCLTSFKLSEMEFANNIKEDPPLMGKPNLILKFLASHIMNKTHYTIQKIVIKK